MTKPELLEYIKKAIDKKTVARLVSAVYLAPQLIQNLIELTFHKETEVAFRAAWVLEYCLVDSSEYMTLNLPQFYNAYLIQKNLSCKRHYTKVLMHYSDKRRKVILVGYDLHPIIETTFEWLIDKATPVAVQVNCMDILFNLKENVNWVEEELKAQIIFLLKDGSAALQSRGKRLLKQINNK